MLRLKKDSECLNVRGGKTLDQNSDKGIISLSNEISVNVIH